VRALVDERYVLAAAGLIGRTHPEAAMRLLTRSFGDQLGEPPAR
jgi:hypothetical protein